MGSSDATGRRRGLPKLFVKYWWQLLVAVGVPLAIAVAVGAWFAYAAELAQIKRTQAVEALALATAVQASVQKEVGYVSRVYAMPRLDDRPAQLTEELEIALSSFPAILQAQVFQGEQERVFVSQLEPTRSIPWRAPTAIVSDNARLPRAKPLLSLAQLGPQQVPVISVTIPSHRYVDERLVMAIDLRAISDLLAQASRRESSRIYLLDKDARVIAHSEAALALSRRDMSALAHVTQARSQPAEAAAGFSAESQDIDRTPVLATAKAVADTDWMLVIERPLDRVVAPIRSEVWRTLVLLALGLVFAAVLGVVLARRFTQPILGLGNDVERIGRGDLAHRARIRTGDEIEQLGEQVNVMAARLEDYTAGLERKVAERTAELEAAMRARALFLAAASHDLRQPLYAISILTDTLAGEPLDPASAEVVEKQREAIAVLRTMFDNLLDLSRFDAGEVKPAIQNMALRDLLAPVVMEAEVVCHSGGLGFHAEIADVRVETDPSLMRRALANLLSNASRYTSQGEVRLKARVDGPEIVVTITDTGLGIAAQDQQRVFEEFVQLANPGRDREKGVGLGLSIVKRICTLLRVPLEMTSEPGRGTTFTLRLPFSPGAQAVVADAAAPQARQAAFDGLRVWIVEDDPLVRDALARQFAAWGARSSFAANAGEIRNLRRLEGCWPDVMVMDDMLGTAEGGLEIAAWLREQMPGERILLVTGNVGPRLRALEDSGLTVLRKPLSSAELAAGVRRAMSASVA